MATYLGLAFLYMAALGVLSSREPAGATMTRKKRRQWRRERLQFNPRLHTR
jgi:hypothetical protein